MLLEFVLWVTYQSCELFEAMYSTKLMMIPVAVLSTRIDWGLLNAPAGHPAVLAEVESIGQHSSEWNDLDHEADFNVCSHINNAKCEQDGDHFICECLEGSTTLTSKVCLHDHVCVGVLLALFLFPF